MMTKKPRRPACGSLWNVYMHIDIFHFFEGICWRSRYKNRKKKMNIAFSSPCFNILKTYNYTTRWASLESYPRTRRNEPWVCIRAKWPIWPEIIPVSPMNNEPWPGLNPIIIYLTIRLWARDLPHQLSVIIDEAERRINYHLKEMESE